MNDKMLSIKEDLPQERFFRLGEESLSDAELLAIILRTGSGNEDVLSVAGKVLSLCGRDGLVSLFHIPLNRLKSIKGIGTVKAVRLKCVAEISRRISAKSKSVGMDFSSADKIAAYYIERLRHEEREVVILVMLNSAMHYLCESKISEGCIDRAIVSNREVLREALEKNASNMILLHNHPSGDPTPSAEDIKVTESLRSAGLLIGIRLLDHIIIGDTRYYSIAAHTDIFGGSINDQ